MPTPSQEWVIRYLCSRSRGINFDFLYNFLMGFLNCTKQCGFFFHFIYFIYDIYVSFSSKYTLKLKTYSQIYGRWHHTTVKEKAYGQYIINGYDLWQIYTFSKMGWSTQNNLIYTAGSCFIIQYFLPCISHRIVSGLNIL